jgi:hypothetical protein
MRQVIQIALGASLMLGGLVLSGCQAANAGDNNHSYGSATPTTPAGGPTQAPAQDSNNGTGTGTTGDNQHPTGSP